MPVGLKRPNPLGLHDLYGNVGEICADRVWRGGEFNQAACECRSARVMNFAAPIRSKGAGFRVLCERSPAPALAARPLGMSSGHLIEYRIAGPPGPFSAGDVRGGVTVTPTSGTAPALVRVTAPDESTRPFSFALRCVESGGTVPVEGVAIGADWDVRFWAWEPVRRGELESPPHWEAVVARPPLDRLSVRAIDFDWGRRAPTPKVPPDYFAAVATAAISLPAGEYEVWHAADDGARVFIDDSPVLTTWPQAQLPATRAQVRLTPGRHRFRIEYFEITGTAELYFGLRPLDPQPHSHPRSP
jgi:hypothetical protein